MSLKSKALTGAKWTTASTIFRVLIQILQISILARLISKEDFGLFATISVILGFASFIVDAGMSGAVIHRQNANKEELGTAYLINVFLGLIVFFIIYFLSVPISRFYDNEKLIGLIRLSSIIFLVQPFGLQYTALLQKSMKFNTLATIEITTSLTGFGVVIFLAFHGYGVKALIFTQIFSTILTTVIVLCVGIRSFGFNACFSLDKASFFFRFGAFQVCEKIINYFNKELDVVLLGKLIGQDSLGIFFMAKKLVYRPVEVINPIVTKVALPIFAQIQDDNERLKRGYLEIVHTLAIFLFPIYFLIAGFSNEVVFMFLGKNWSEASTILVILSFYVLQRAIGNPIGSLLIAKGKVDLGFYWNFAVLFYVPPLIWIGSHWGSIGVSCFLVIAMLGLQIPGWYFLVYRTCQATLVEYYEKLLINLFWAMGCFGGLLFMDNLIIKLVMGFIGSLAYLALYRSKIFPLLAWYIFPHKSSTDLENFL